MLHSMIKKFFYICIFTTINSIYFFAQDDHNSKLLKENSIQSIDGYVHKNKEKTDSVLVTREIFNTMGKKILIEIYNNGQFENKYEFIYYNDTVLLQKNLYDQQKKLISIQKIKKDKIKRIDHWEFYDSLELKTGISNQLFYDKNNNLIRKTLQTNKEKITDVKYKYHKNGKLKKEIIILPKEEATTIHYNIEGKMDWNPDSDFQYIEDLIQNKSENGMKVIKRFYKFNKGLKIVGLAGRISVKKFDTLETILYYDEIGLLSSETQFKNRKFLSEKKYYYNRFQ